jgi:hypothetical protein
MSIVLVYISGMSSLVCMAQANDQGKQGTVRGRLLETYQRR